MDRAYGSMQRAALRRSLELSLSHWRVRSFADPRADRLRGGPSPKGGDAIATRTDRPAA